MVIEILGAGFEEVEALAPVDMLRRAGVEVKTAAVGGSKTVSGAHGVAVKADMLLDEVDTKSIEMLILPGGMGGVESIMASDSAMSLVDNACRSGVCVAAICAAPMILGRLGYARGRRMVIYPGMEEFISGAEVPRGVKACADGQFITGLGPGAAFDFGYEVVRRMAGDETAQDVKNKMQIG